jgi:hypothetical protein
MRARPDLRERVRPSPGARGKPRGAGVGADLSPVLEWTDPLERDEKVVRGPSLKGPVAVLNSLPSGEEDEFAGPSSERPLDDLVGMRHADSGTSSPSWTLACRVAVK